MKHVLNTGASKCFDQHGREINCLASGQDAAVQSGIPWPDPRFEAVDDLIIEDHLTGLLWTKNSGLNDFPLDWQDSQAFIRSMNTELRFGRDDWRLPNRREMRSLIDHSTCLPALPNINPFTDINLGWYWTSTSSARNSNYAWYVHLEGGRMFYGRKTEFYWFWPVAGTSNVLPRTGEIACLDEAPLLTGRDGCLRMGVIWPEPRFIIRTDNVLDRLTGLTWYLNIGSQNPLSWTEALAAVRALAKKTGVSWRLPTINELESLVDASQHDPALPADHPFLSLQNGYWSSTTSGYAPDWAFVLYLQRGAVGVGFKRNRDFHLWPVMTEQRER
jgi:hypothetical protein